MSSNPIKYNASTETRALRKGNFYIGTRDSGKSTVGGYYSGVNPPQNGYVVYLNKSGGPAVYSAADDAGLISLTNTIAKTSYTTVAECFAYFAGQTDKMVVNRTYPFMWTDGLVMNLDASFLPSFPRTGTTWYDLSTSVNSGTATNGPTFNSYGYFTLDGADDYFTLGNNSSLWVTGDQTLEFVVYPKRRDRRQNFYNKAYGGEGTITYETDGSLSYYYGTAGGDTAPYQGFGSTSSAMSTLNLWYHVALVRDLSSASKTLKWYINGVLNTQTPASYSAAVASSNQVVIGTGYTNPFQGDILYARQYSTALTQTQLLQNYHQAPIVTSGMVLSIDAGNLVSYSPGTTAVYSLVGTYTGTLVNGTSYTAASSGGWVFDGTDDKINTNLTGAVTDLTVECWYLGTKGTRNHLWDFGLQGDSTNLNFNFNDSGYDLWVYWNGSGTNRVRYNISGSFTDGTIKHIVFTHTGSTNKTYLNGVELTITESGGTQTFTNVNGSSYFRLGGDVIFAGNIYMARVYNRALSATEIYSNFVAQKYRYGL